MRDLMATRLQAIATSGVSYLSDECNHHRSIARLMEKLEQLKSSTRDTRGHIVRAASAG